MFNTRDFAHERQSLLHHQTTEKKTLACAFQSFLTTFTNFSSTSSTSSATDNFSSSSLSSLLWYKVSPSWEEVVYSLANRDEDSIEPDKISFNEKRSMTSTHRCPRIQWWSWHLDNKRMPMSIREPYVLCKTSAVVVFQTVLPGDSRRMKLHHSLISVSRGGGRSLGARRRDTFSAWSTVQSIDH